MRQQHAPGELGEKAVKGPARGLLARPEDLDIVDARRHHHFARAQVRGGLARGDYPNAGGVEAEAARDAGDEAVASEHAAEEQAPRPPRPSNTGYTNVEESIVAM